MHPSHRATARRGRHGRVLLLAAVLLLAGGAAEAGETASEAVSPDALDWWSVDAGGGRANGGTWIATVTIGQPDAGTLTGGDLVLEGGFVVRDEVGETPLFADGFETGNHGAWSSATP